MRRLLGAGPNQQPIGAAPNIADVVRVRRRKVCYPKILA
jgi:hypothetical protein